MRLDPASAIGTGYSEAKWVAEQILYYAADKANIPVSVVRLGQLCGDNSGHWNEREWFPAMVKSALFTRCLPDIRDVRKLASYTLVTLNMHLVGGVVYSKLRWLTCVR